MSEHRLTGLALLHTHKDIIVNIEEVINRFANEKKKKRTIIIIIIPIFEQYIVIAI